MDAAFQVVAFVVISAGEWREERRGENALIPEGEIIVMSCLNRHLPALPQSLQFVNSVQIKTHK